MMGRFLAIVIALSGCGRLGFDDMGPGGKPGVGTSPTGPDGTQPTAQQTPQTCGSSSFSTSLVSGVDDLDLAVAVTPTGPALFGAAKSGGSLYGIALSADLMTAGQTKLVSNGNFAATSASYVAGTLIASAISGSTVVVYKVPAGLASASQLAMLDGMYVSKDTMLLANGDRITPTACSAGLTVNPFDASWAPTSSQLAVTTNQSTGIASTAFGTDAMVVWSTSSDCHLERVVNFGTGSGGMQGWACPSPRIASDVTNSVGELAYEATDGVRVADFTSDAVDGSSTLVAPGATSPRVVFDGTNFWYAYLESTGAIAVGLEHGGEFQATTTDLTAKHDAFELVLVNGTVWVVSASQSNVEARAICLE